jgi:Protein of unknown function (DUF4244)
MPEAPIPDSRIQLLEPDSSNPRAQHESSTPGSPNELEPGKQDTRNHLQPAMPHTRNLLERGLRGTLNHPHARRINRLYTSRVNRRQARAQRGAITAEYAIIIVGACAIGGVLVSILRSPGMQNALKAIINYGLKIAGVEGVHL